MSAKPTTMPTTLVGSQAVNDKAQGVGGLCHLVEAATALSKLVESSPPKGNPSASPDALLTAAPTATAATTVEKSVISDDDDESSCKKNGVRSKREIFPQRLMAILNDASLAEIVTWLPNGRSFVIVRPDVFTESVLPKYLPPVDARGSTKYPSFTRKLNRWGFRQITRGPDTGAFHHPLFRRDEPVLCLQMVCQRSRDRRSSGNGASNKTAGQRKKSEVNKGGDNPLVTPTKTPLQPTKPTLASTLTTAYVSSDDNASSSSRGSFSSGRSSSSSQSTGSRARVSLLNVALPPSTVCTTSNATTTTATTTSPALLRPSQQQPRAATLPKPPPAGYVVSKDAALIQEALRQSVENERIRAAKAMLYHSYMQALGASRS